MTRHNVYLPKENIPKIAEVREINTEIPTYEEFLKTYQEDEKLSESYENEIDSYSNIEAPKGYGSCYVCYKDTQWTNLYISCPTSSCGSNSTSYWYHSNNGYLNASDQSRCGTLRISNKGDIRCERCGASSPIKNWSFSCSSHRGNYWTVNFDSFQRSMMFAGDFNEMITDLHTYLRNH